MTKSDSAWARLATAIALLAALAALFFAFLPVRADISVLMPERESSELNLLFRALQEGPAIRVVLIGLQRGADDGPIDRPGSLSRAFKTELRGSGFFDEVSNGEVALDEAALRPFFDYRYRLNPPLDPGGFSASGLRAALEVLLIRLQGLGAPLVEGIMTADPTLRTLEVAANWAPSSSAEKRQGVWVGGAARRVLLLARTKDAGFDVAGYEAMSAAVHGAAARLESEFGPLRLTLSGPSVIAAESRRRAEAESRRVTLIAVPLVAGLLLVFFRRLAVLPLSVLPLAAGFLAGMAAVTAVFGFIHVTTLGFGVTLIGVAVDYPLHLMTHHRPDVAPSQAARRVWPAMRLGAMTTILGFLPLALSSFPGVSQLGVFTVAGLAVAVAVTRWGLPRVLPMAGVGARVGSNKTLERLHSAAARGRVAAVVLGLAALVFLVVRGQDLWQQDLAALSPVPEKLRSEDRMLRADLNVASPRYLLTVSGGTTEEVLQRSEPLLPHLAALRAAGHLEDYDLAARFLPSAAAQTTRLAALPEVAVLRDNLAQAQRGLPFKAGAFEPFLRAVAAATAGRPIQPGDPLAPELRLRLDSLLLQADGGYSGLVLLHDLRNPDELRASLNAARLAGVGFLDLKQTTQDLMNTYRGETLNWAGLGGGLALVLLVAAIRSARGVAEVSLPVILSVAITAAAVSTIDDGLTIFHLLALLMVAGLGIDYAVFLRRSTGPSARERIEHGDDLRAVCLCAATSFSVFAVLASADIPILSQIGTTVALGSFLSLVLAFVFTGRRESPAA